MYNLKIFDSINDLGKFLIKNNIKDYSFRKFEFEYFGKIKSNFFLSYK